MLKDILRKKFKDILSEADPSSSCPNLGLHLYRSFPLIPSSPLVPLSLASLLLRPKLPFPVLSQESQVFQPIWQLFFPSDPRLGILNVTSTSWQMSTFFIPVTPQWFPWEETGHRPPSLPQGCPDTVGWLSSDVPLCPEAQAAHEFLTLGWELQPSDGQWPEQLILTLRSLIKVPQLLDEKCCGNHNLGGK